jgi:DNA polymerase
MLAEIAAEVARCTKCRLAAKRRNTVPGEGRDDARIMFVGEGPGEQEDLQGRPFVGPAGQFLNELLQRAGLRREDVFITNIVKCRPPQNREPMSDEVQACNEYLVGQIAAINPRVICPLGSAATRVLLDAKAKISGLHGKPVRSGGILYVPLYHPAAAIHKPDLRDSIIEDFKKLRALIADTA